jgi:hypothetical protein
MECYFKEDLIKKKLNRERIKSIKFINLRSIRNECRSWGNSFDVSHCFFETCNHTGRSWEYPFVAETQGFHYVFIQHYLPVLLP